MIKQDINKVVLIVTGILMLTTLAQAQSKPKPQPQPLWTYSAPSPSSVSVSAGGSATVTYTVTSHTNKPKSLVLQTNPPAPHPSTPGITASSCTLPVKGSTCTLTTTINGSQVPTGGIHGGPYLCQADSNGTPNPNQCYQPSAAHSLNITKNTTQPTSLELSVSNLALSVIGYTEYGVTGTPPSGAARLITLTNTGSSTASNLSYTYPTWSTGTPTTTTTTTCNSTLAAGGTCTITIHPGNTATSDGTNPCTSGVAPTPQTLSVSADNASAVSSHIVILGYGCIYQSGYVYALDDTQGCSGSTCTGSVGGKVVTTSDQIAAYPNGIVWGSNGGTGGGTGGFDSVDVSYDVLPGIDETSTASVGSPTYTTPAGPTGFTFTGFFGATYSNPNPFTSASFSKCNGISDGSCNTGNIVTFYNQFITNNTEGNGGTPLFAASPGPTTITYYAAGLCKQTIGTYSNWYLPAVCEMGYYNPGVGGNNAGCGSSTIPTLQNIQTSLIDLSNFTSPAGYYWSSTERSGLPQVIAWYQYFASGGGSNQDYAGKGVQLGVRCSRVLTI